MDQNGWRLAVDSWQPEAQVAFTELAVDGWPNLDAVEVFTIRNSQFTTRDLRRCFRLDG
jgi:hypothetical protein